MKKLLVWSYISIVIQKHNFLIWQHNLKEHYVIYLHSTMLQPFKPSFRMFFAGPERLFLLKLVWSCPLRICPVLCGHHRLQDMKPLRAQMDFSTDVELVSFLLNRQAPAQTFLLALSSHRLSKVLLTDLCSLRLDFFVVWPRQIFPANRILIGIDQ